MFNFKSVGHFFASVVHDLKVGAQYLEAHEAQINAAVATGVAVISLADPALAPLAVVISRAEEALLGDFLAVIEKAGDAGHADGLNLKLDADTVAAGKKLLSDIKKLKPVAANPPAGLPTTA